MMARSRGRPRKSVPAPHQPRDPGTDETVNRRNVLAGGGDPAKTTCPIDVLYAQGVIDDRQLEAAQRYASDYRRVYGQTSVSAAAYEFRDRNTGPDEEDADERRRNQAVWDRMTKLGRHMEQGVAGLIDYAGSLRELIVYEVTPRWMTANPPREKDEMAGRIFMQALKHLVGMND